jgi:predicted GNAT family N-acyltransferase
MKNELGVRFVTHLDEAHVGQLHELYQHEWRSRGRTRSDVALMLEHSDHVFGFCAEPDDRLVAFARVLTDRVFKALIFDVIVASAHRGGGLGRRLMDEIVKHPALAPVRHLELYCLPEMVPFYEKWRFSTDVAGVRYMRRNT